MNLLKSPLRRTAAAAAGALIGLAGVMVFASPAAAHHPIVSAGTSCQLDDGTWQVTWHVQNSEHDLEGKLLEVVTVPDVPVEGIAVGVTLPPKKDGDASIVTGTQVLGADVLTSKLAVKGEWYRNGQRVVNKKFHYESVVEVDKPTEKCTPPTSTPPTTTPPATEPPATTPPATEPPATTPPATTPPATTPPAEDELGEPTPIIEGDCDSITIGMDNPDDGFEFTLDFKTSKGEERTLEFAPGERKTEKFSATEGFEVTLTITVEGESFSETVAFEQPEGCESGSGGGSELPVTGAAAGGIAGGAALLLAIGAGLFVMARRRKVKFTA